MGEVDVKADIDKEVLKNNKSEKRRSKLISVLSIISVLGFSIALLFLSGITGAVIGPARGNIYGLIMIIVICVVWVLVVITRNKD